MCLRKKTTVKFWFLTVEFDIGVAILEDYFVEEEEEIKKEEK